MIPIIYGQKHADRFIEFHQTLLQIQTQSNTP